jgi:hypothetical protein
MFMSGFKEGDGKTTDFLNTFRRRVNVGVIKVVLTFDAEFYETFTRLSNQSFCPHCSIEISNDS